MRGGRQRAAMLPDGRRLHLQDGPIDLVIEAVGSGAAVQAAYRAAVERFSGLLDELCSELDVLRSPAPRRSVGGPTARRMARAVAPYESEIFITPMAAVAGAVADEILGAMTQAADLERASVNNGGDIALHLARGARTVVGLVDRADWGGMKGRPGLFGRATIAAGDPVRGIATSGAGGRSFSLGIADAVTVLARTAAEADADATVIANAVDLPDHPGIARAPAASVAPDSDLGDRLITRHVPALPRDAIAAALGRGEGEARRLLARGLIVACALHLQGITTLVGDLLGVDADSRPALAPAPANTIPLGGGYAHV